MERLHYWTSIVPFNAHKRYDSTHHGINEWKQRASHCSAAVQLMERMSLVTWRERVQLVEGSFYFIEDESCVIQINILSQRMIQILYMWFFSIYNCTRASICNKDMAISQNNNELTLKERANSSRGLRTEDPWNQLMQIQGKLIRINEFTRVGLWLYVLECREMLFWLPLMTPYLILLLV